MSTNRLSGTPNRSMRRTVIIAAVVVLTVVAIAATATVQLLSHTTFTARKAAEEYLSAIAQGHYDQATAMVDPGIEDGQRVLLTDAAYGKDGAMADVRIFDGRENPDGSVTFPIAYAVGEMDVTDSLTVVSRGRRNLFFSDWAVTTPLLRRVSVAFPTTIGSLSVNGVAVSAQNATFANNVMMTFKAYPGTYDFRLIGSKYIQSDSVRVSTDRPQTMRTASLTAKPTEELRTVIQQRIDEWTDSCTQPTPTARVNGCLFHYMGVGTWNASSYRNFSWNVTKRPQLDRLSIEGTVNSYVTDMGEATVSFETTSHGNGWQKETQTVDSRVGGNFSIDGDDVKVELYKAY